MRQPSMMAATAALSITALFFSIGGGTWAANGAAFVLGLATNSATQRTGLTANVNGNALELTNTSAGAAASALKLTTATTRPPMAVNSNIKVSHLNADWLDGIDSTALTRVRRIPFTLAVGASTDPIALPANLPVHIMLTDGTCAGEATIFSKNGNVAWAGAENCFDSSQPPNGGGSDVGHRIVVVASAGGGINSTSALAVEVDTGGAIRVRNSNSFHGTYSGEITLIW